jgi:hypothetical protein
MTDRAWEPVGWLMKARGLDAGLRQVHVEMVLPE